MEIFEGGSRNFLRKGYGNTERYSLDTTGDSKHRSGDGDEPLGRFYVELQTVPPYLIYFQSSQSVSIFPSFPPFSLLPSNCPFSYFPRLFSDGALQPGNKVGL